MRACTDAEPGRQAASEAVVVPCVGIPYSIRYRWERSMGLWIVQVVDENGGQVGEEGYAVSRKDLPPVLEAMAKAAFARYGPAIGV